MLVEKMLAQRLLAHQAHWPRPVLLRARLGRHEVEAEIGVFGLELFELLDIESLAQVARRIPEAHATVALQAEKLVEDQRAHRRHARARGNEAHLLARLACEKVAERARDGHAVAGLEVEQPGTQDARRNVVAVFGREGDADGEQQHALLQRVARHRIGTLHRRGHHRAEAPQVELVPFRAELGLDVELAERKLMRRAFDLNVAAGAERHLLAFRQGKLQLLDEGRDVTIAQNLA